MHPRTAFDSRQSRWQHCARLRCRRGRLPMTRMTGNHFFAEAMRAYGVTHLFFVPSVLGGAMAEMDSVGVRKVITHGEKAAAYMADGYARASHRPGICLCQDIGTTNLAAGLRDAYMGSSPVI